MMLTVLGGGPAGLGVAYAARRQGYPVTLYEARDRVGGNCVTFRVECGGEDYRFDSGAHRFHDKDPEVTAELFGLMGEELRRVEAPSQIYTANGFVDFPFSAARLPFQLGFPETIRAVVDYLRRPRLSGSWDPTCFEELAVGRYGRALADRFLLGYSEKLWGASGSELSPEISGKRLKGLDVWSSLRKAIGRQTDSPHMEGSFYYPLDGYGRICERLAEFVGEERIATGRRVTGLVHDGRRVTHVRLDGDDPEEVDVVCSTLPLDVALHCLRPEPPREILDAVVGIRFRNLLLVALFFDRPRITDNATVYFPDPQIPFTRVVEPRNRSPRMAPRGRTSLVAEIPCFQDDRIWTVEDDELAVEVAERLSRLGWFDGGEILGHAVRRLTHAYPVLDLEAESGVRHILAYLDGLENFEVVGRNGRFVYRHLHDMLRCGFDTVASLEERGRFKVA